MLVAAVMIVTMVLVVVVGADDQWWLSPMLVMEFVARKVQMGELTAVVMEWWDFAVAVMVMMTKVTLTKMTASLVYSTGDEHWVKAKDEAMHDCDYHGYCRCVTYR